MLKLHKRKCNFRKSHLSMGLLLISSSSSFELTVLLNKIQVSMLNC